MTISPQLGIVIMMNNYLHDVATALLAASAFCLWILLRSTREHSQPEAIDLFLEAYRKLAFMVKAALVWIVVGGVPRTIFYQDFEWANAAGKGQVAALVVKHVLIAAMVVGGSVAWVRLKRRVRELEAGQPG